MTKLFVLTKVMMKGSLNSLNSMQGFKSKKSDSKLKKYATYGLFIFLFIYMAALVYFPSKYILENMVKIGQPSLVISLVNSVAPLFVLFFTIAAIPGIFYFSKDIESYIPLPFKAWEITAAKFITAYIQTLITLLVLLLPLFFNYFVIVKPSVFFLLTALITSLMLPVIPLAISLLLVAVLMRFVPFLKNKNLYIYFSTAFIMIPVFIFTFSLSSVDTNADLVDVFMKSITAMDDSVYSMFSLFFPTSKMFTLGMVENNMIQLLLGSVISIGFAIGTIILVQPLYFQAVIGINESSSKKRNLRLNEMDSATKVRSITNTFMIKDLKTILGTPSFAMNYFSAFIILPVMGIIPLFTSKINFKEVFANFTVFKDIVHEFFYTMTLIDQWELLVMVGVAAGILIANFEASSSTAISREGIAYKQYLTMPVQFSDITHAKAKLSIIFSSIYSAIFIIPLLAIIQPRIDSIVVFLLSFALGILLTTYLSILVDVLFPSLEWTTEQQAVKGNIVQVMVIIPLMFAPFIFVAMYFFFNPIINLLIVGILFPIILIAFVKLTTKASNTRLVSKVQNL